MWLINTANLQLHEFNSNSCPPYAILSHTWEGEEVTFQDAMNEMLTGEHESVPEPKRHSVEKIKNFCQKAERAYNLDFAWVDTCCIDKSSSAELSEAINSMFSWYRQSVVCIVYLQDVQAGEMIEETIKRALRLKPNLRENISEADFEKILEGEDKTRIAFLASKWFQRGWTLQELIAPLKVNFFDAEWTLIGNRYLFRTEIYLILGMSIYGLQSLGLSSVAARMSLVGNRATSRPEDMAYCLMGRFDINLPLLYGEGGWKAFQRLQVAIMEKWDDESLFAWSPSQHVEQFLGLLANCPADFINSGGIRVWSSTRLDIAGVPYPPRQLPTITPRGIHVEFDFHDPHIYPWYQRLSGTGHDEGVKAVVLDCRRAKSGEYQRPVIFLSKLFNEYVRLPILGYTSLQLTFERLDRKEIYVIQRLNDQLKWDIKKWE